MTKRNTSSTIRIRRKQEVSDMSKYYINGWTDTEERKLIEIMINGMNGDMGVHELFYEAEKQIGRSSKSCMNRWYTIRHKHLKQIV